MIQLEPVAYVRGSRQEVTDDFWGGSESRIELAEPYGPEALDGIEEFSHVEILFHFDRLPLAQLSTGLRRPRGNPAWPLVGIFAQRAKARPNRLGSTMVRLLRREPRALIVAELDAIDGTPVVDIKPVVREFLPRGEVRQPGWYSELMREYWAAAR